MKDIDQVGGDVLDVAPKLQRELGPGLLESVHQALSAGRLAALGYRVSGQQAIDIEFDGIKIAGAFKLDLLVDGRLIGDKIGRTTDARARQTIADLFEAVETARRAVHRFRRRDTQRGCETARRRPHPCVLGASARTKILGD